MKRITEVFLGVVIFLVTMAVFGFMAMFLWNKLLPGIFGLPVINYWQTVGLMILTRIIFGSYQGIGKGLSERKKPIRNRWDGLSEGERRIFIQRYGDPFLYNTGKETEAQKERN
ncbi:hypothetical protein LQZ19_17530 [Treponema primitia]|uniref:hypothetical protein n=1 Tax=Treponema primitia TaxID=88058 RepID=UPI003980EC17